MQQICVPGCVIYISVVHLFSPLNGDFIYVYWLTEVAPKPDLICIHIMHYDTLRGRMPVIYLYDCIYRFVYKKNIYSTYYQRRRTVFLLGRVRGYRKLALRRFFLSIHLPSPNGGERGGVRDTFLLPPALRGTLF